MWTFLIAMALLGFIGMLPDIVDAYWEARSAWSRWQWRREKRKKDKKASNP